MRQLEGYLFYFLFFMLAGCGETKEVEFWEWFKDNESKLYAFENDRESIFNELSERMNEVDEDLTFEFGPVESSGVREFVISGGGIKSVFPKVEALHAIAPKLSKWKFTKYRQRRSPMTDISFGGIKVKASEVYYKLYEDGDKVGIILFMKGMNEKDRDKFGNIGFLILDEAIGEFDVATKVGFIEFHSLESEQFSNSKPINELVGQFDSIVK